MITEASIVKAGQQDIVNYLFYAEDLNGNFQVAHSGAFFGDPNNIETPPADAALNDLVAKLLALGWQQITVGIPSPWYSFEFKRESSRVQTSGLSARSEPFPDCVSRMS